MAPVNLFKKYETSSSKETTGIEIDIDGAVFICRRAGGGNRRYKFALADAAMASQAALQSADQDVVAAAEDEATLRAYAESVVVGWRNVADRDGNDWPFSKENFIELMQSCPDIWAELRVRARDIEKFRIERVSQEGTELGKSSSGTDSGETTSNA